LGAVTRADSANKKIALVFTGHEFADGGDFIARTLQQEKIKGSFFFTGDFFRNPAFTKLIVELKKQGNYIAPHSDKHLLYCDWTKRDSLLVTKEQFKKDLQQNYRMMSRFGIREEQARYFLPPYEWYNDSIAAWTQQMGFQLINFTPGTRSTADYTTPEMKNYRSSDEIWASVINAEQTRPAGLNGFILLIHTGTDPKRTDKFYKRLPELIQYCKARGYQFQRVDELLKAD
jgi:peptidoglycan/xylan/chitin deacetylase (PgdA/CDA1 family)